MAGLAVFALGFVVAWVAGPPFEVPPERLCGTELAERSSYATSPSAIPAGATECVVTTPDGRTLTHDYVPWTEWLRLALLAAAVAAAAGVLVGRLLGVDPEPPEGVVVALGTGVLIAGTVLLVAAAVMMGTARGPLRAAVRALRTAERQEVPGG